MRMQLLEDATYTADKLVLVDGEQHPAVVVRFHGPWIVVEQHGATSVYPSTHVAAVHGLAPTDTDTRVGVLR